MKNGAKLFLRVNIEEYYVDIRISIVFDQNAIVMWGLSIILITCK